MKNHHLDLVRVTEAAAIAAAGWVGRGDKEGADKAATDAMRDRLNKIDFVAQIAIGEGIKDEAPGLFEGEILGLRRSVQFSATDYTDPSTYREVSSGNPDYCIAVDPIEGTTPTAKGGYEAMSVIALAGNGCFFKTSHFYMNKLAVGPKVKELFAQELKITDPVGRVLWTIATALDKQVKHLTVCVLDRPRNSLLAEELRAEGCRIKFISDCDVTGCIATCVEGGGIDAYMGIGGAPEAVISAAAMECMGGMLYAQLVDSVDFSPVDEEVHTNETLVRGPVMFAATGITDGSLLKGVQFTRRGPVTHSIAMRSESGTVRRIITEHGN